MNEMEMQINKYEPMMHSILRKFKIKRDYEDIMQILRIKTWEVLRDRKHKKAYIDKEGNIVGAKLSTLLYKILSNKLLDVLKTEYGIRPAEDLKNIDMDKMMAYYIKNPMTYGNPFLPIENYDSEDAIRCRLDFEQYLSQLPKEDNLLLALMEKYAGDKETVAKDLKCTVRTINRNLLRLRKDYREYLSKGGKHNG
jgi:RNA polymerase sigma factor (sigma-70 family)